MRLLSYWVNRIRKKYLFNHKAKTAINTSCIINQNPSGRFWKSSILLILILSASEISAKELFWSECIEKAINLRDSFEKHIGVDSINIHIDSLGQNQKVKLLNRLENQILRDNPWYYYYHGILNKSQQGQFFNYSLYQSIEDPGTTWLQFIAFATNGYDIWATMALEQLEKQLFQSGADQSILISEQLFHYAFTCEEKGDIKNALNYYQWAQRFTTHSSSLKSRTMWFYFHHDFNIFLKTLTDFYHIITNSWRIQLDIYLSIFNFFKLWFMIFSLSVAIFFLIKYLPAALHQISDIFPPSIPSYLKTILSMAAYLSLIGFGILPFLWCTAFTIHKYLSHKEKLIFSSVLMLITIAPIEIHLQSIFSRAQNPDFPAIRFYRSVHEGFSNKAYKNVTNSLKSKPDDILLLLAATNYALKNNDLNAALFFSEATIALRPNDPVVLTTSGNVAFLKNDIDKAESLYIKANDINKNIPEALYNLGQCYLRKFKTTEGMDLINRAVAVSPFYINTFIKKNDQHFSDSIPLLRQIMFVDCPPGIFWSNIIDFVYDKKTAEALWGTSLMGFSTWISFTISIIFSVLLLLMQFTENKNKVRKLFECKFCGRIICKKCRNGSLCNSCADTTMFVHNVNTIGKIKLKITQKVRFTKNSFILFMNIIFPGSGSLFQNDTPLLKSIFKLLFTSLIYGTYIILMNSPSYLSTMQKEHVYVLVIGLLYSLFFAIRNGIFLFKEIKTYILNVEG